MVEQVRAKVHLRVVRLVAKVILGPFHPPSSGRPFTGSARPAMRDGQKKRAWGALKGVWVPHDTRDQVVDFVKRWSGKTGITVLSFLLWLGIATSKWHSW